MDNRQNEHAILDFSGRHDLVLAARNAEREAADTARMSRELAMWIDRLDPYFDKNPQLTVAEALELYRRSGKNS